MILLTFAHRGEAQSFISRFKLKTEDNKLFLNDDLLLLITGEGIYEASISLSYALAKYNPSQVINYGIAGSLSKKALIDHIYKIRTAYYYRDSIEFKSYTDDGELDCISTDQRVLEDTYAATLSNFAHIIDREAWAIGKSCKTHKTRFSIYKLISDIAGSETACFDIKEKAQEFSTKMLNHFLALNISKQDEQSYNFSFDGINLSFTQKALLKKLCELDSRKQEISSSGIFEKMKLKLNDLSKKESIAFLKTYHKNLLPFQAKASEQFIKTTDGLSSIGVNCTTDSNFEKQTVSINFQINSQKNIDNLIAELQNLSFESFQNIWNGDIDV